MFFSPSALGNRLLRSLWLCASVVLVGSIALAGAAATGNGLRRLIAEPDRAVVWVLLFSAGAGALTGVHLRWMRHWPARRFLLVTVGVALVGRSLLVLAGHGYEQLADRLFFLRFVEQLGPPWWLPEIPAELSGQHDYPLWTGRSWPQHLLLHNCFGAGHVVAQQYFNVLLSAMLLPLAYALGRRVQGDATGRWAVIVLLLNPLHSFMVLDYTYQYQGALLLGLVILQGMRFTTAENWAISRWLWNASAMSLLLALLSLQRGLDLLALAILGGAGLFVWIRSGVRTAIRLALLGVVVPLALARLCVAPLDRHFAAQDHQKLYSHAVAQAGIGLNLVTEGEFLDRLVQVDYVTRDAEAGTFLRRLVVAQLRDAPLETLVALPAIKITKYLQIGAASGLEEGLPDSGPLGQRSAFRLLRVVYAPLLLLLALVGAWRLRGAPLTGAAWVLVVCVAGCFVIYAFLNQVSPRYSFYIQPALAVLGVLAFTGGTLSPTREHGFRPFLGHAVGMLAGYVVLAGALVLVCRGPGQAHGFARLDSPKGWVLGENGVAPWVRTVSDTRFMPGSTASFRFDVEMAPETSAYVRVEGYFWSSDLKSPAITLGENIQGVQLREERGVGRFALEMKTPSVGSTLPLCFVGRVGDKPSAPHVTLGYVSVMPVVRSATTNSDTPQGKLPTRSQ